MTINAISKPRFSGHETFACRFSWLPKAVRLIESDPSALSSDEQAILSLGLGKNMVRSLRFWLDAFDVAAPAADGWALKAFGAALLGRGGADPFIERTETQWLLHWSVTSRAHAPLFAWRHVFHRRMRSDFTRGELFSEMRRESAREGYDHSEITLMQHIDALLHTYVPSHAMRAPEDVLDGPLVDLKLIQAAGRRRGATGKDEQAYSLARIPASKVGSTVIDYAIERYWSERRPGERVLSFRDLAYSEGSPGATFRISEDDLRVHLERNGAAYSFRASGDAGAISRNDEPDPAALLRSIYA
ncbi:DUF4007 family protein [Methylobacterium sp. E-041]|uniref:DUF4007 family protein n=1 Tax=Methylobacterium sp. E-041 TaxID=2836573 RepID=UPI001FBB4215|nr:DUF4007 family protein [Methylobacterium sp. E-041]MCJ2108090.1 DUF4007 family protein [Methylobacterium sp. E-041]